MSVTKVWSALILKRHAIEAIIHFAGSIVVPESVTDPLKYYHNNTVKSRALIASAVQAGVRSFIFSSTAAVYGNCETVPVPEERRAASAIALRHLQADDRADAGGHGAGA